MTLPLLTPFEAKQRCQTEDPFTHEGFLYILDGPQGCPKSEMAAFAVHIESETNFAPNGEGPVTAQMAWLQMWF
jgi:hypothetical protein